MASGCFGLMGRLGLNVEDRTFKTVVPDGFCLESWNFMATYLLQKMSRHSTLSTEFVLLLQAATGQPLMGTGHLGGNPGI